MPVSRQSLHKGLHPTSDAWQYSSSLPGRLLGQTAVYKVELVKPPPLGLCERKDPLYRWSRDPDGVFVAGDWVGDYDAVAEADALVASVTASRLSDDDKLTELVNTWGLFGAAARKCTAEVEDHEWDSVSLTRAELTDIQRLANWLGAMQADDWDSPHLPTKEHLRSVTGAKHLRRQHRESMCQFAFALAVNEKMRPVLPQLATDSDPLLMPFFELASPLDAAYLRLRQQFTLDGQTARYCVGCRGLFFVGTNNHRRIYCSPRCKNRENVKKYRSRRRDLP